MSLWKIAWRSIEQRALASALTAISMALGVTLVVAVLVIHSVIGDSFRKNSGLGYNMIVGAKGGKLQLVLNTVFYLSAPVENIPYSYYKEFAEPGGKFKPYVDKAIPLCLGDYYGDYRVIGTTPAMFDDFEYSSGKKYQFASGRNFEHEHFFEAVVGSVVAVTEHLKVGSEVEPSHGAPGGHKHEPFKVVGILAPTGTPNDRAVFVNMEGFYLLENHAKPVEDEAGEKHEHEKEHGHKEHTEKDHKHSDEHKEKPADHKHEDSKTADAADATPHREEKHADEKHADEKHVDEKHADKHEHAHKENEKGHAHHDHGDHDHEHHHEPLPENQREVTAVLVRTTDDIAMLYMMKPINKDGIAQAVSPISEITKLFASIVDPIQTVLLVLTVLIVIVSGIGILVSIYTSMSERRHEIAVIRALGAGRQTVMLIVLLESILLSLGGGVLGWLLGHGLIAAMDPWITPRTGVSIGFLHFVSYELVIIPGLVVLASLVGYLPAMTAYRTDVAKALSETP